MAAKMAEVLSADPSPCTSCWTLAEAGEADGWLAFQSVHATHVGLRGWHHPRPSRWVGLRVHVEAQHQGHSQVCGWLCLLPLNHVDAAVFCLAPQASKGALTGSLHRRRAATCSALAGWSGATQRGRGCIRGPRNTCRSQMPRCRCARAGWEMLASCMLAARYQGPSSHHHYRTCTYGAFAAVGVP